tara:strand:+ start:289 stop:714 length:426 start_codon:yes stop_codon:yes gene_type:complete
MYKKYTEHPLPQKNDDDLTDEDWQSIFKFCGGIIVILALLFFSKPNLKAHQTELKTWYSNCVEKVKSETFYGNMPESMARAFLLDITLVFDVISDLSNDSPEKICLDRIKYEDGWFISRTYDSSTDKQLTWGFLWFFVFEV